MFKAPHLITILLTAIIVPIWVNHLKKEDSKHIDGFFKFWGIAVLFFEPSLWIYIYVTEGALNPATELPLYICSLFWLLMPYAVYGKDTPLRHIARANICTVGFTGGLLGLVFNIYVASYPFFSFIPIKSLTYHFAMILVSCAMWATGYYKPKAGDEYRAFIPMLLMMVPALILNKLYGWDYYYTAGGIGTPLTVLSNHMPKAAFLIFLYGLMFICIRFVFYRHTSYKFKEIIHWKGHVHIK